MTNKVLAVLSKHSKQEETRDGIASYELSNSRLDSVTAIVKGPDGCTKVAMTLTLTPEGVVGVEVTKYEDFTVNSLFRHVERLND